MDKLTEGHTCTCFSGVGMKDAACDTLKPGKIYAVMFFFIFFLLLVYDIFSVIRFHRGLRLGYQTNIL